MTDLVPEPTEDEAPQPSRRGFLAVTGGGAAALAGVSMVGAAESADAHVLLSKKIRVGDGPFIAYVENVKSGKVVVYAGGKATRFTDKSLVRRIVRKAGN